MVPAGQSGFSSLLPQGVSETSWAREHGLGNVLPGQGDGRCGAGLLQPSRAAPNGGPPTLIPPPPPGGSHRSHAHQSHAKSGTRPRARTERTDDVHAPGPTPSASYEPRARTSPGHTRACQQAVQAHSCIPVQRSHRPLNAPVSGVTCWQVCVWKHTLLHNLTPLTSGAHRGSQPGPAQAPLARPTWTHLQMGSAAAGAGGTGSSRNRGSSRWWWRPRPRRGSRRRRCPLWSWDLDKEQVPSPSNLKGGILTTPTVTLGSDPWPAGSHHKPRCGSPGGAVPDWCG